MGVGREGKAGPTLEKVINRFILDLYVSGFYFKPLAAMLVSDFF